jgi:hypothetical protein
LPSSIFGVRSNLTPDTVRKFKERNKLGRFADRPELEITDYSHLTDAMKIGDRCEVEIDESGEFKKRGTVKYIGALIAYCEVPYEF